LSKHCVYKPENCWRECVSGGKQQCLGLLDTTPEEYQLQPCI